MFKREGGGYRAIKWIRADTEVCKWIGADGAGKTG